MLEKLIENDPLVIPHMRYDTQLPYNEPAIFALGLTGLLNKTL